MKLYNNYRKSHIFLDNLYTINSQIIISFDSALLLEIVTRLY